MVQSKEKNREIDNESVWEWKRKKETFFIPQVTNKEDKLVEFFWSFEYYIHEKLECSQKDFAIGIVVRLYLLLEIYLL